jgi:hypothetical protein
VKGAGGLLARVVGRMLKRAVGIINMDDRQVAMKKCTRGGLKYSIPMLRDFREVLRISFMRLYFSTLKLRVGPADKRTIRSDGASGVRVNASRWVTCKAGARVR